MLIIAERINTSRKSIAEAVTENDTDFIVNEIKIQEEAGADYIDINAGTFAAQEIEKLSWLIEIVQKNTDLPICLDSADPKTIHTVLPMIHHPPMINSINLDRKRYDALMPMIIERQCKVIGLCQAAGKAGHSISEKIDIAGQLIQELTQSGLFLENIYIDPLVFSLATDTTSGLNTLNAIREIMNKYKGVHTICGLTNVSYGLPERKLMNSAFLISAILMGLDAAIMDPTNKPLFSLMKAALLLNDKDPYAQNYIKAFRQGRFS